MKTYASPKATRLVLPIVEHFPHDPVNGEILIINSRDARGVRWYDEPNKRWVPLNATVSNIWERHVVTEDKQHIFELSNMYTTDGNSIVAYLDGVRLPSKRVVEINNKTIIIPVWYNEELRIDEYLKEGQVLEFQIFNLIQ